MAKLEEQLLQTLQELKEEEFKRFIPVDLMVQKYQRPGALQVTTKVFGKDQQEGSRSAFNKRLTNKGKLGEGV